MLSKQAKTLTAPDLRRVLRAVKHGRHAKRDKVIVLLSVRAGLRACEIAGLTWGMVTDANGRIADIIDIRTGIAKRRSGRRLPMHPALRRALIDLKTSTKPEDRAAGDPVVKSGKTGHMKPNSIVNWFVALYAELGLEGCSSHSGRRTFITNAARKLHQAGASLRDVQMLAGHRSIETTQGYIDGQSQAQRKLVGII